MIARPFSLEYEEREDEVRITVGGELDRLVADRFSRALRDAELSGARRVLLETAELTFMDSAGLALVLQGARRAAAQHREFLVVEPAGPVRRLLEIAAMGHLIAPG